MPRFSAGEEDTSGFDGTETRVQAASCSLVQLIESTPWKYGKWFAREIEGASIWEANRDFEPRVLRLRDRHPEFCFSRQHHWLGCQEDGSWWDISIALKQHKWWRLNLCVHHIPVKIRRQSSLLHPPIALIIQVLFTSWEVWETLCYFREDTNHGFTNHVVFVF